jgi:endonuclease/exonuclease/phosphatase family metal-dependent hydrolase
MKYKLTFLFIQLALPICLMGQTMLIDEDFSDWTSDQIVQEDAMGDGLNNSLDFHRIWMADDEENLYLRIELGREIELQEFEDLFLYVDLDNNINTGISTQNMGADLVYRFGQRDGFLKLGNDFYDLAHTDLNLVTLPTVSSSQFEISISKIIQYFQGQTTMANRINLVFVDNKTQGDRIPNSGVIAYEMNSEEFSPPTANLLKQQSTDLRIMSYNVLSDGIFDIQRQPAFQRIIRAMQPDILCFQEIYDHSSLEVAQLMEVFLPSMENAQWFHRRVSPDIILVSRYPITAAASSDGNGIFQIDVNEQPIIVVDAHLPCCNNDMERQIEIDRLMSFIRASIDGLTNILIQNQTPIFIVGDMNLVGDRQQQISLITGDILNENLFGEDFNPDWDGSSLDDAIPFEYGQPHAVTWFNRFGSFSKGRLDYLLYTGSVVELNNALALQTANLPMADLAALELFSSDTEVASDHYPCIMDVNLNPESGLELSRQTAYPIDIWPNPVEDFISFILPIEDKNARVQIHSLDGKVMFESMLAILKENPTNLCIMDFHPGVYLIEIQTSKNMYTSRFVKD